MSETTVGESVPVESPKEEECAPCRVGILIGITEQICKMNELADCDKLVDDVKEGRMTVQELAETVRERVGSELDKKTMESVLRIANGHR